MRFADGRRPLDVVTLGEVMALHLAEPGVPLAEAHSFRRTLAGSEFNVAVGLARLGRRVAWIGRLGDDSGGRLALSRLRGEGIDTSAVRIDERHPTGLLVRDCHSRRVVTVEYHRRGSAGSRLGGDDIHADLVARSRVLFVSGITPLLSASARAAQEAAMEAAARAGTTIVFDPNPRRKLASPGRARAVLRETATRADVVLTGLDEARTLSGRSSAGAAAEWFLEQGAALVVVKDGANGSSARDGRTEWTQPALPASVRDPVGAGDAFDAGLLSALLEGRTVDVALHEAAAVAALVVAATGDIEGLPGRTTLDAYLRTDGVHR